MQLIYVEDKYIKQYDSIVNGYNIENTVEEILSGKKEIVKKKMDIQYLKNLIKNNGNCNKEKPKKKKKSNIETRGKNCVAIYKELIKEGYELDFYQSGLYAKLEPLGIFYKNNNSFYIQDEYILKGYFINGKETKNNDGYKRYQILITEEGKQFIIDILKLKKKEIG